VDDRRAVAWIHRRAGFGLHPDELDVAAARGPAAELDRLFGQVGQPPAADWDDAQLPLDPKDPKARIYAIHQWLDLMVGTQQPLVDRMAWLWHGHFVSAADKVRVARFMVDQIRLFRRAGLGGFPDLVAAVAVDPAMLLYLDGRASSGRAPNENFARELMELFTLGVGHYGEPDVTAAAAALTGWRLTLRAPGAVLVPARHDDRPQHYLGVDGVHDVPTVVAALTAQPALPSSIAGMVAAELLGVADAATVGRLAAALTASGLRLDTLVRATLGAGLAGTTGKVVMGPVPWLVMAQRITGAALGPGPRLLGLRAAGQLPTRRQPTVVLRPASFDFAKGIRPELLARMADPPAEDPLMAAAQGATARAVAAVKAFGDLADPALTGADANDTDPPAREGGASLADGLATAAQLVTGDVGTRIVVVSASGFDTHANQAATQKALLADLAAGLTAFTAAIDQAGMADRVLVATTSEFGRRVQENGSGGTDHGKAGVSLLLDPVRPGIQGSLDLGDLQDGDVRPAVDPRVLYTAALDWLGADPAEILGRRYDDIPLLA